MRVVPATEFKQNVLRLLDIVAATGDEIIVSKHGVPIAKLVPLEGPDSGRPLAGSVTITNAGDDLDLHAEWEAAEGLWEPA